MKKTKNRFSIFLCSWNYKAFKCGELCIFKTVLSVIDFRRSMLFIFSFSHSFMQCYNSNSQWTKMKFQAICNKYPLIIPALFGSLLKLKAIFATKYQLSSISIIFLVKSFSFIHIQSLMLHRKHVVLCILIIMKF